MDIIIKIHKIKCIQNLYLRNSVILKFMIPLYAHAGAHMHVVLNDECSYWC